MREFWIKSSAIYKVAWADLIGLVMDETGNIFPIREDTSVETMSSPRHSDRILQIIKRCSEDVSFNPHCPRILDIVGEDLPTLLGEEWIEWLPAFTEVAAELGEVHIRIFSHEVGIDFYKSPISASKVRRIQEYVETNYTTLLYGPSGDDECTIVISRYLCWPTGTRGEGVEFTAYFGEDWVKAMRRRI